MVFVPKRGAAWVIPPTHLPLDLVLTSGVPAAAVEKVRALAGQAFGALFVEVLTFKPAADFRTAARAYLGRKAARLIAACESEAAPRVSFETKRLTAPPAG